MQKTPQKCLQNENFFALILRALRARFFKNADFRCKMKIYFFRLYSRCAFFNCFR